MLAELYVLSGRDAGKVVNMAQASPTIFLGRAATNHLRIRDPQASRVHCRIEFSTAGLTVADTNSGNGTYLNGERLPHSEPQPLTDGDEITVGGTRLLILIETDEDRELWGNGKSNGSQPSHESNLDGSALEHTTLEHTSLEAATAPAAVPVAAPITAEEPSVDPRDPPTAMGKIDPDLVLTTDSTTDLEPTASEPELVVVGPPASKPRLRPGTKRKKKALREVVPGYLLEARLAGGSRSGIAVYRAMQQSLDRSVALKVFLPRVAEPDPASARVADRFLREAKAIARLPHPNIVTIHDVISRGKLRAIVMEYLAGGSLADRLDDGQPLNLEEVLVLGEAVARALSYLHAHGVIHRAVKPSNVLLARSHKTYKLAGFSFATGPRGERVGDTQFFDDHEGAAYLPPEQLKADPGVDARSDIYSLGAVLYACCAGRPPFEGEGLPVLGVSILRDAPAPLSDDLPASLRTIISRCLAKDPDGRYPDGGSLLHELRACRSTLEPEST